MRRRFLSILLVLSMIATVFTGCGEKEVTSEEVQTTESIVEETEVIQEETVETVTTKTKDELILENEFHNSYIDLHGYWVNDDVSYYFNSFVKDEKVVFFYTTTEEPDNWFTYEITSEEVLIDFKLEDQYSSHRLMINVTDKDGNTKEVEFDMLTDFFASQKHVDIVSDNGTLNLTKLSEYSSSFTEAFNYYRFIDLKTDDNGNVTLTPVEIKDITSHALVNKDGKDGIYFCSDSSKGYYSFLKDTYSYVYDGYYEEEGFRDKYSFYGLTAYPWSYELVKNPYLEVGADFFDPIPLSEEILGGYVYRVSKDKSFTFNGVEGLYLDDYSYYLDDSYGDDFTFSSFIFRYPENPSVSKCVALEVLEKNYFDDVDSGKKEVLNLSSYHGGVVGNRAGIIKREDYIIGYDSNGKADYITVLFCKEDLTFVIELEADDADNDYSNTVEKARKVFDSFTVPNGEKTIDEHLKETFPFAGYTFAEDVKFTDIVRDAESIYGLKFISTGNLRYMFNRSYDDRAGEGSGITITQIHDTEFEGDFEIHIQKSATTGVTDCIIAYCPGDISKYIRVDNTTLELTIDEAISIIKSSFAWEKKNENNVENKKDISVDSNTSTDSESKIECLDDVMGLRLDGFEFMGVYYDIYSEGAVFRSIEDDIWMIQETVPYGDKEFPVVCVSNISEEGFELPESVQYLGSPIEDYEGYIGYFYNGKNIEIPEQIKYFNCSMSDSDVESFKILSDKTQVPDYIKGWFINCKSLKTVSLPDTIEGFSGTHKNGTFEGCESLSEIELPSNLKIIGAKTFKDCSSLTNISIPEGVTTIGEEAFAGTNITSIEYPEGLTFLALNAFSNTPLEELIIPDTVTDTEGVVNNMPELKTLIIPNSITKYNSMQILNCPKLEYIELPDSLEDFSIDFTWGSNSDIDKSKLVIKVNSRIADYLQKKYPEYNIVAKD